MSVHERFATLLNRIAVAPNIARARREDAERREHAIVVRQIDAGVARAVKRLEKRVDEIEKSLA